jgi:hypothetical protein
LTLVKDVFNDIYSIIISISTCARNTIRYFCVRLNIIGIITGRKAFRNVSGKTSGRAVADGHLG